MERFSIKRLALVIMSLSLVHVESRPFELTESKDAIQGPEILESRMAVVQGAALIRMTKNMLDPDVKDLNKTILLRRMGRNFDSQFMSVTRPVINKRPDGMSLTVRTAPIQRQAGTMPWRIQQLQFEIQRGENARRRVLGHRASMKLRQWLWELSKCPIKYTWVDYGAKVFPRYIRYGQCMKKPCSFPAGMTCQPRNTRTLRLLIWICPPNAINSCGWHPFSLRVFTSCKCGCSR